MPDTMHMFLEACGRGDVEAVRRLIASDPSLVHAGTPQASHSGWTGLHEAAKRGQAGVVRVLLEHGGNPNARETGDNTYPLHWAAAHGHLEVVRALLDAGSDVHGFGDVHELDVIGWATFFRAPGDDSMQMGLSTRPVVSLLLERGARHHIFSAMCVGDLTLIRQVVERDPEAIRRSMSRFERRQSPLHFAVDRKRYDILDLLIALGADLEAKDAGDQTPLATAMLRGDREAMTRLQAAGAIPPGTLGASELATGMAALAASVKKGVPMIYVPDVARALDWYTSIGFSELTRFADDGVVNFGMVAFGQAEVMMNMHGKPDPHGVSLWFYTDRIDSLYQLLKARQLEAAQASLEGAPGAPPAVEFQQDIEDMFYGARQFCIRDLNGYQLYFIQSAGT